MTGFLGVSVGHYRVLELLGKGGMGEVYVGYDEKLDRRVALKSLRSDRRPDAETKARFLREARVLSQLAHPNICQIFDYVEGDEADVLVLELIDGQSLTEAMKKGLGFRQKLLTAEQIAGVLVAAHDKGVVHRDLKPDNVMLTEGDQVKVLDFGLSRFHREEVTQVLAPSPLARPPSVEPALLEGEGSQAADEVSQGPSTESTGDLTTMGTILGTLGYMSPEQARGEGASTASDLYSFGLLLQELFTGKPPYEKGLEAAPLLRKAMAGETLPVEGVDADLAALVGRLKSLAPAARPSAVDTAERLAWIRRKPARRKRKILVAAVMVILALFGVAMTVQTVRATRAERAARQEAATSKKVSDFLVGLFKVSDPGEAKGNAVTARELLDKGAERIEQELKEQPEIQARLMGTMGVVYEKLGLYQQAQLLLETALAIREKALGPDHPDVAASVNDVAILYWDQHRYDKAEPLFERSLRIREKTLGPEDPEVAAAFNNLALLYKDQGKYAEAEPLFQRSLSIREKVLGPEDPEVANVLSNLALLYDGQGKHAQAEPLFQRSLSIREKARAPDHPEVAQDLMNLAIHYAKQGRYAEAGPLFQRSLEIREKTLGSSHPLVATSIMNLACFFADQGNYGEAEPLFQRSLSIREKALGPDHPLVSSSLSNLANLYKNQGKYAEAEPLFQRSLSIREKVLGPDHPRVANSLDDLADLYKGQAKYAQAEALLLRSVGIYEKALGQEGPDLALSLYNLAMVYARQGKRAEAVAFLKRALPQEGDAPWMRSIGEEPDFLSLQGDPEFERVVAEVKRRADASGTAGDGSR